MRVCSGLVKCHVRVTRTGVRVIKTGAICLFPFAPFCLLFLFFSFSTCFYHPDPCPCHPDVALHQPTAYSHLYPFVFPKKHAHTYEKVRQPRIRLFSCLMIDPSRETGLKQQMSLLSFLHVALRVTKAKSTRNCGALCGSPQ